MTARDRADAVVAHYLYTGYSESDVRDGILEAITEAVAEERERVRTQVMGKEPSTTKTMHERHSHAAGVRAFKADLVMDWQAEDAKE